jgi:hypothetical protein
MEKCWEICPECTEEKHQECLGITGLTDDYKGLLCMRIADCPCRTIRTNCLGCTLYFEGKVLAEP